LTLTYVNVKNITFYRNKFIFKYKENNQLPAKAAPKKSKSVLKRARQTKELTLQNRAAKNTLKTLSKNVEKEVSGKNAEAAQAALKKVISEIDKAARKNLLHRNTASRNISRLTRLVNSILPAAAKSKTSSTSSESSGRFYTKSASYRL
jgi:small subunit ribosomal protein S20